jgi:hypothetical protein
MLRREQYRRAARAIAVYLAERQRPNGSFPGPDHYGVASALWLWSQFGVDFARQLDRAWTRLRDHPPADYGEFNAYALLHCRQRLGERPVDSVIRGLRLAGRHSANWMLLRAVCRALPGPWLSPHRARLEARAALIWHCRRGFIEDRPGVRSFGYHAFCGALLADLWQAQGFRWAGRAAARAAGCLAPFVLPNGDALYLGRGQQQIFGQGALLYLLEAARGLDNDPGHAPAAERAFRRMMRFQRRDGSFPLVLREGEEPEPWRPDPSRPGWFSYNRYADYLPFLGCMLLKAASADLPPVGEAAPPARPPQPGLRSVSKGRYTAVYGAPGGPPTNELSFPYLSVDGESLFPCYGREEQRVEPGEFPLPYLVASDGNGVSFRDRLSYRLTETGLLGLSPLARHERSFAFEEDGFECSDVITFLRRCSWASFVPANFLFRALRRSGDGYVTWHGEVEASITLAPPGSMHQDAAVTASGRLIALRHQVERAEATPGQRFAVKLSVRFPSPPNTRA